MFFFYSKTPCFTRIQTNKLVKLTIYLCSDYQFVESLLEDDFLTRWNILVQLGSK